jgi:hypothetical protein
MALGINGMYYLVLSVVMRVSRLLKCYSECHYAGCHYAECR